MAGREAGEGMGGGVEIRTGVEQVSWNYKLTFIIKVSSFGRSKTESSEAKAPSGLSCTGFESTSLWEERKREWKG